MRKPLLFLLTGLSLAACQQDDDVTPKDIKADFDTSFGLYYRQQAHLPKSTPTALTIKLEELQYNLCPKNVVCCFVPNYVSPTLTVTDAKGQTQQVKLPTGRTSLYNPAWIDTTNVRANNRKYLVEYNRWDTNPNLREDQNAEKKDIRVWLRVTEVNN